MPNKYRSAFLAYPEQPADLAGTIKSAVEAVRASACKLQITPWPEIHIFGVGLADKVREEIRNSDFLICDITRPNLNVYYEIGFAIGLGKPIAPVLNVSFSNVQKDIQRDGFFDGIGYKRYENSAELSRILQEAPEHSLLELYGKKVNFQQPLFVLDSFRKTDFRNAIISAIKASNVFFRSFDPVEIPRFSTIPIIAETTSSAGIVVPLLAPHLDDSASHNLRAAFLGGIAHGLGRQTVLLQKDFDLVPADYREFVQSVSTEKDIEVLIGDFAKNSILSAQSIRTKKTKSRKNALQKLTLGASSAENEFRSLENYFVETAEYLRTIRGEARIVAGRKGSGKTAIFFQVRDYYRSKRDSYVTDLKPESHQLSYFRAELLKISDVWRFRSYISGFLVFCFTCRDFIDNKRRIRI